MIGKAYVLLGDIVHSRKIESKELFMTALNTALNHANIDFKSDFHAPLKSIKGLDEIGGAMKSIHNFYRISTILTESLHPVKLRISVVYGVIDLGYNSGDIVKMDGPAIHKASETIEHLRQQKLLFDLYVDNPIIDSSLTGQLNLLGLIKKKWSQRQMEVFRKYRQSRNQRQVANELGITQQAVSAFLNHSMYRQIELLEEKLNQTFERYSLSINQKERNNANLHNYSSGLPSINIHERPGS